MHPYRFLLSMCFTELFFILFDYGMYYGYGHGHSTVPFWIGMGLTAGVIGLTSMAIYQTFIHRHDKESW